MTPALLSTYQLSELLGVDPRSIERWRQTGDTPRYLKLGRLVRYDPRDVETWLAEKSAQSTSSEGA